jgi:hypothetical protein
MSARKENRRILIGCYLVLEEYFDQASAFLGLKKIYPRNSARSFWAEGVPKSVIASSLV